MSKLKKGRISKEEERIISRLIESLTVEDIAKQLNRDVESVDNFIKRKFKVGLTNEEFAAYSLEDRPYWIELQSQFTDEELELFKYHWSRIISQFKDDVFPTEELQVVDVIKLEILMNRCLKGNKENIEQIRTYDKMIQEERSRDKDQQDMDYIINLERQVASLKASQESLNRDYRELQTKKATMLREMKGTREQRIKRLEDSKQSFTSWVANLMQNPELMKKYGIEMEKMRIAMKKEEERLSAFHKYEDGTIDQPFLTPKTVKD
jgi:DNA-binding CsgD family transcriptional regulator